MAKLTLSADEEVITLAKRIAAENHTTVSAMFARLVRAMAAGGRNGKGKPVVAPITLQMTGLIKLPKGKTYRQVLEDALCEKYGQ